MENKKTLILSFITVIAVVAVLLFLPKQLIERKDKPHKLGIGLSELEFDYNRDAFLAQFSDGQSSQISDKQNSQNTPESKEFDLINFIPLYDYNSEWNWQRRMSFAVSDWKEKCMSGDANLGFKYATGEFCSNLDISQTSQKDMGTLTLKIEKVPDSYYGIRSIFYLENNGKKINLSEHQQGVSFGPEEFAVHPSGSVLVNYYYLESPDGSLPYGYYFNGEKWFTVDDIAKTCIPEKYQKLGFGEKIGGFGFGVKMSKEYLYLTEMPDFLDDAYNDIFNTARLLYFEGPLVFKCNIKDLSFDSYTNDSSEYLFMHRTEIIPEEIAEKADTDFRSFHEWVFNKNEEDLKKEYMSWTNVFSIKDAYEKDLEIRLPSGWSITQKEEQPDSYGFIYRVYTLNNSSELSFSFNNNFLPGFNTYGLDPDVYVINSEILKILYTIKVGLDK